MKTPHAPATKVMKALVYHGPGKRSWEDRPVPEVREPTDAIVRVTATTICGTDLHILKGDVPSVTPDRVLGHEAVGVVEKTGTAARRFQKGEKVLVSCITACGLCERCRRGMPSHCADGGWRLGHLIDGTQAEFVRVPYADGSLHPLPRQGDDGALAMLSDIFPTAYECGVLNGKVRPGSTVAIVGAGPIGLAALITAKLFSPGQVLCLDYDDNRLDAARHLGATGCIDPGQGQAVAQVLAMTGGLGVDAVIEAVGTPESFDLCQSIVAPGGVLANVGVHGRPVVLHLERLWAHNISLTTRLVDTTTTPELLKMAHGGLLDPGRLVTHRFKLADIEQAYHTFANAAHARALKVVLSP